MKKITKWRARGASLSERQPPSSGRSTVRGAGGRPHRRCIVLIALVFCACADKEDGQSMHLLKPPVKAGQSIDPQSKYVKDWPGRPGVFKLNDRVVLQIPPQFHKFWEQRHWLTGKDLVQRPPLDIGHMKVNPTIGFVMHFPDFEGYSPENYLKEFDEDRVEVVNISPASPTQMEPEAPGRYPPNSFARFLKYSHVDPKDYQELYGLRCYQEPGDVSKRTCYGRRDSPAEEYLILEIELPPYPPHVVFPQMRTSYFSPRYGGLEIAWRSHMKNFPQWREIDAQVWKYIDAWNVAGPIPGSTTASSPSSIR